MNINRINTDKFQNNNYIYMTFIRNFDVQKMLYFFWKN